MHKMSRCCCCYSVEDIDSINQELETIWHVNDRFQTDVNSQVVQMRETVDKINTSLTSHVDQAQDMHDRSQTKVNLEIAQLRDAIDRINTVLTSHVDQARGVLGAVEIEEPKLVDGKQVWGAFKIRNHRRISAVSKGVEPYDVVVKVQLDELREEIDHVKRSLGQDAPPKA